MVELRMLKDLQKAPAGAVFWRGATKDDALHSHVDERAGAHGARLFRDVKFAFIEPPIAQHTFGLSDRQHFSMRGGVLQNLDLVAGAGDDLPLVDDDRPD